MSLNSDIHLRRPSGYSQIMNGRQMRKCLETKGTPQLQRARNAVLHPHSVMQIVMNRGAETGVI